MFTFSCKKLTDILNYFFFFLSSLQACTTNVSMPPVIVAGCLASRQLVSMETVNPASSSPLKLTVPTKWPPSTQMLAMSQTNGHMWQSHMMACTWSSSSTVPRWPSAESNQVISSAIWPKTAKCWWLEGMHWIIITGEQWRGWVYGGMPEGRGRLSGICRAVRTPKIYLTWSFVKPLSTQGESGWL